MPNRLVSVDEDLHLPDAVQAQLVADITPQVLTDEIVAEHVSTIGSDTSDALTARLTPLTGVSLPDIAGTNVQHFGTTWAGKRWDLRMGTSAAPRQGGGPGFKISQVENITNLATQMGGNPGDNAANAALNVSVECVTGSLGQTNAILATAKGAPTGTDVCALAAWGRVTAGTGTGFGAYLEGRRDVAGARTAGAEVRVQNEGGADGVVSVTGISDTIGIWVTTASSTHFKSAVGVALGATEPTTAPFKVGYQVTQGGVTNHSFRDESGSEVSFMSRGNHITGLDLGAATFTGYPIILPAGTTAATGGISFGNDVFIYRTGANSAQISASAGLSLDGNLALVDGRNISIGTGTGTRIGTAATQKISFYGVTPKVQPGGWTNITGTSTKGGFDTASVTLPVLAQNVKALYDALFSLGLLGA